MTATKMTASATVLKTYAVMRSRTKEERTKEERTKEVRMRRARRARRARREGRARRARREGTKLECPIRDVCATTLRKA